ncbi:MAG TPA: hypothetical protein VFU93_02900 [Acidimicrobiales bacterium]|nr:hypothetical protein [Acidimicrobiales bacterium]
MRAATYALAAWTLFTWGTRIRNAAQDDEGALAFVVPVVLTVLAIMAIVRPRRWGRLLALAASLAWLVRVPIIVLGDEGVAFKVVHTALAVVTWALAAWTLRVEARHPATASST